jgi:hypothetical protein
MGGPPKTHDLRDRRFPTFCGLWALPILDLYNVLHLGNHDASSVKVATAIVEHIEQSNWKIESGTTTGGHGQHIIPPRNSS